jgi:two-component system chemotaxis response regulator CheY
MRQSILAVDDSRTMRDMLSFTLKQAGYTVVEANDGQDALTKSKGQAFDLVITDVNMPGMDGIALVKELRKTGNYRTTPILVLTTESDREKKDEGRRAGATGWIVKPFNPEKLLQTVKKVCPS